MAAVMRALSIVLPLLLAAQLTDCKKRADDSGQQAAREEPVAAPPSTPPPASPPAAAADPSSSAAGLPAPTATDSASPPPPPTNPTKASVRAAAPRVGKARRPADTALQTPDKPTEVSPAPPAAVPAKRTPDPGTLPLDMKPYDDQATPPKQPPTMRDDKPYGSRWGERRRSPQPPHRKPAPPVSC